MPNKRLVRIGEEPKLPTISEFFTEMAERQNEEIVRLKKEALDADANTSSSTVKSTRKTTKAKSSKKVEPYPWLLHPVRKVSAKKARKKASTKTARPKAAGRTRTSATGRKAAKKKK